MMGKREAPGVIAFQDTLEARVFLLHSFKCIIDQTPDALELVLARLPVFNGQLRAEWNFGVGTEEIPARQCRHPENVSFGEVVAGFEFAGDQLLDIVAEIIFVLRIAKMLFQLGAPFPKSVRDVFQED